jgi:MYXO-CTERM domain-containing protein
MRRLSAALVTLLLLAAPAAAQPVKIDVLFVIDDSATMQTKQSAFLAGFYHWLTSVDALPWGRPDLHLGVVSTDLGIGPYSFDTCTGVGKDGLLQATAQIDGCTPPTDRWISDEVGASGQRVTNYTAPLPQTFNCIALLGLGGCGFEQPLAAMRRALDGTHAENAGFLRDDALLAVVVLTDEDDCSASDTAVFDPDAEATLGPMTSFRCAEYGVTCDGSTLPRLPGDYTSCVPREGSYLAHPDEYHDFLVGLKGSGNVFFAAVAGASSPFSVAYDTELVLFVEGACSGPLGAAAPGVRLNHLVADLAPDSTWESACVDPLTASFDALTAWIAARTPPGPDAGPTPGADAGTGPGTTPGCGCQTGRGPGSGTALLALLLLGLCGMTCRART